MEVFLEINRNSQGILENNYYRDPGNSTLDRIHQIRKKLYVLKFMNGNQEDFPDRTDSQFKRFCTNTLYKLYRDCHFTTSYSNTPFKTNGIVQGPSEKLYSLS